MKGLTVTATSLRRRRRDVNTVSERKSMEHKNVDIHVDKKVVAFINNTTCRPIWFHVVRAAPWNKVT